MQWCDGAMVQWCIGAQWGVVAPNQVSTFLVCVSGAQKFLIVLRWGGTQTGVPSFVFAFYAHVIFILFGGVVVVDPNQVSPFFFFASLTHRRFEI